MFPQCSLKAHLHVLLLPLITGTIDWNEKVCSCSASGIQIVVCFCKDVQGLLLFLMNSAVLKDQTKRLKVQGCFSMDNRECLSEKELQLSILSYIRLLIAGLSTLTRGSVIPAYSTRLHDDWGCMGRQYNTRQCEHLSLNRICMSLEETTLPLANPPQEGSRNREAKPQLEACDLVRKHLPATKEGLIHSSCPWWYTQHGLVHFSDHCFLKNIFIFSHSDWGRDDLVINSSWVTFDGPQGNRSHTHVRLDDNSKTEQEALGEKKEGTQRYSPSSLLISGPEAKKKPEALISLWPWS